MTDDEERLRREAAVAAWQAERARWGSGSHPQQIAAEERRLDESFREGVRQAFGPKPKQTIWADHSKPFEEYVDQALSRYPVGSPGAAQQAVELVLNWVERNEPADCRAGFVEFVKKALTEYIEARIKAQAKRRG